MRGGSRAIRLFFGKEFLRYTAVSAVALGVDIATLWLAVVSFGVEQSLAAAAAYATGLGVHYALSVRFVFGYRRLAARRHAEASVYVLSGLLGIVMSAAVVYVGGRLGQPLPVSKAVAVVVTFIAVFAIRKATLFTDRAPRSAP